MPVIYLECLIQFCIFLYFCFFFFNGSFLCYDIFTCWEHNCSPELYIILYIIVHIKHRYHYNTLIRITCLNYTYYRVYATFDFSYYLKSLSVNKACFRTVSRLLITYYTLMAIECGLSYNYSNNRENEILSSSTHNNDKAHIKCILLSHR